MDMTDREQRGMEIAKVARIDSKPDGSATTFAASSARFTSLASKRSFGAGSGRFRPEKKNSQFW
jgi:hypothetical protein